MKILITICLLAANITCYGQETGILSNIRGDVQIQVPGSTTTRHAYPGSKIYDNEILLLPATGEVKVTCIQGTAIMLNAATVNAINIVSKLVSVDTIASDGVTIKIKVSQIAQSCQSPQGSVLLSIAGYLKNEIWENNENRGTGIGGVTGAVTRGERCDDTAFQVFDTLCVAKGSLDMELLRKSSVPAIINVYSDDADGIPIKSISTRNNVFQLSSLAQMKKGQYWYAIESEGKAGCCNKHVLRIMDKDEYDNTVTGYTNAVALLTNNIAEQNYLLGRLLEREHLLAGAWQDYQAAAKMDKKYKKAAAAFAKYYGVKE